MIEVDGIDLLVQLGAAHGVLLPDPQWADMIQSLHPKQRAFVIDPSKRKCALAGRRGGKSYGIIYWLIEHWRSFPGETSLYIAQTLDHARGILWEDLKAVCRRWGIAVKWNEARLEGTFPNGYKVRLRGAENTKQAEKMRGPHYWRVVIDECHLFADALLRHLINRVIDPALMDLNGELVLCGTPGYDLIGLWYEATAKGRSESEDDDATDWTTHHWTCLDNPYIRGGGASYIERKKRENNWTDDNPELIREYFGRWFHDPDSLVYTFDGERNFYWDPEWEPGVQGVKFVIGVDVGWHDGCGFTVCAKRADGAVIRVVESFSEVGLDDPKIAMIIKRLMRAYKTRNVYVDTKGGGKVTAETLKHYGIPAEAAIGGLKRPRIEYLRGLLIDGTLQLHPEKAAQLAGELRTIPWGLDKDGKKVEHKTGYIDECTDGCINAVLMLSQTWALKAELPPLGTPERDRLEEKRELAAAIQRGQRRFGKRGAAVRAPRMPTS